MNAHVGIVVYTCISSVRMPNIAGYVTGCRLCDRLFGYVTGCPGSMHYIIVVTQPAVPFTCTCSLKMHSMAYFLLKLLEVTRK